MSISPSDPVVEVPKRAVFFFDGQNLFHSAKESFGYEYPNYHPLKLSLAICEIRGWQMSQTRFYTGVPKVQDSPHWHNFWSAKKRNLMRDPRVFFYSRDLQYRNKKTSFNFDSNKIFLPDGSRLPLRTRLLLPDGSVEDEEFSVSIGEEKGIDVRIALDIVNLSQRNEYDIGIVVSQDQDLIDAVAEARKIARDQGRSVEMFSAFPISSRTKNARPINGTKEIFIDKELYDECLDPSNYGRR